jgi:hypothetical protein
MARTAAQRRRDAEKHPELAVLPEDMVTVTAENGGPPTHAAPTVLYRGTVIPDFCTLCGVRAGISIRDQRSVADLGCRSCQELVYKIQRRVK